MLYPLIFHPTFKERIWGGRRLAELYGKPLPSAIPIGESWEISDRPGDVSVIANGPLAGKDLHWLVQNHHRELLGSSPLEHGRFPLLIKILDAREKLSLQVHPPVSKAAALGGEAKTEMWYIAEASPGALLYAGLKRGTTREEFEDRIRTGTVAECFHRLEVAAGEAMFLPSGRVHAIGAGLVIFEIQQNSDTTYRVYDWDRCGIDGKPRALHIRESLASIDFKDYEPSLVARDLAEVESAHSRPLVSDPLFSVEACQVAAGVNYPLLPLRMQILGVVTGRVRVRSGGEVLTLTPGQFCLVPACLADVVLDGEMTSTFLRIEAGRGAS
jgi:mannose-6-phosphate isomerase